eukprot:TRINITY_DN4096_c0_g1_i1.p1 TRINITY_DN4096_c0_g1~~TRINITY_DN4096_c0_g1_i1.p1  ORF type:complete len:740 (-),score=74.83 TRINITY_DN4096_c0_g1_i1:100-2319(-)
MTVESVFSFAFVSHMADVLDIYNEATVCCNIRCMRLQVPLRFKHDDLEASFEEMLKQRTENHWVTVLLIVCLGSLLAVVSLWEDFLLIAQQRAEPWNFFVAVPALCMLIISVACAICQLVSSSFFTESRRYVFFMLHVCRFALFSRPVAMGIFQFDWQYTASQSFHPHSAVLVLTCMMCTSLSCQSVCFRCSRSWSMCIFSLTVILVQAFALPEGREALQESLMLIAMFVIQALICFCGHVTSEAAERRVFLNLHDSRKMVVAERVKRCEAERRADSSTQAAKNEDRASSRNGREASEAASQVSSAIFKALDRDGFQNEEAAPVLVNALQALGEEEYWLIKSKDLTLSCDQILGKGGFGSVVVGTWMSGQVAVKVPKLRKQGERHPLALEMRHLRKLRHPCIVSFLGICLDDQDYEVLLVEEFVTGDNLNGFMRTLGAFARQYVDFRQHVCQDISAALHYLHCQPSAIVHGDLKPENVLIDRVGLNAKLTDFGLARRAAVDKMPGGTPRWLEPRLRGRHCKDGVSCSSDIWAFGGIAFFLCTGLGPWEGNSIRGSTSMEAFGANIFELWRSGTDEDTWLAADNNEYPHVLSKLDDVDFLAALCSNCMAVDTKTRPTAGDVNLRVRNWPNTNRPCGKLSDDEDAQSCSDCSVNESCSQSSRLSEQIALVRAIPQSNGFEQHADLPLDVLNDVKAVLCEQVELLRSLPGLNSHRETASNVIHMLLATVLLEYRSHTTSISL